MTFYPFPSKFELFDRCAYPWATTAPEWPERPLGADARFGIAVGRVAECLSTLGGKPEVVARYVAELDGLTPGETRKLVACAEHIARDLDPTDRFRSTEQGVLYDLASDTARLVDREAAMRPPPGHFGGILDLLAVDAKGRVWVRDYKSGRRQATESTIGKSAQARTYALFAHRALGLTSDPVFVELSHVDEEGITPDADKLDSFDLRVVRSEVRERARRCDSQTPVAPIVPAPGPHCRRGYCPIVSACPATRVALLRVAESVGLATYDATQDPQSAEHAASSLRQLEAVEAALPALRLKVENYARAHGAVPLGDSLYYGLVEEKGKERVDMSAPGAVDALRRILGDDADVALEVSASAASIERAARKVAERDEAVTAASVKRATLADLRAIGAVRQGAPVQRYTTFQKKEK